MTTTETRPPSWSRDSRAMLGTLGRYWLAVFPVARAELAHWRERAAAVPDETLRGHALTTLADEHLNAEGAAVFATFAPRAHRALATRLLVRYQVMYDYLDTLTEQPVAAPLAASRHLHRALTAALGESPPAAGYYARYPHSDDGGYLQELVSASRTAFHALPASSSAAAAVLRAARRSAEGQSQNHAAMLTHSPTLECWATRATPAGSGLCWWETAAAAGSSLAIHALLAAAADPKLTAAAAQQIEGAYWPWINGLNTLLESMIDSREDADTDNHSYVSHYTSPQLMAARLELIAEEAACAARQLPRARQHVAILTGMAAFYLASPDARLPPARVAARQVRQRIGSSLALPLALLRARRRLSRLCDRVTTRVRPSPASASNRRR
jgi:tetraprenyl-beta-curcumene synthase